MALTFWWPNKLKKLKGVSKKELDDAIKKLEKKILTNEESINTTIDMVHSNETKITELENKVTTLKNNVNSFIDEQVRINKNNSLEIQNLKNDINANSKKIAKLTENITTLTEKIDSYDKFKNDQIEFNKQLVSVITNADVMVRDYALFINFPNNKIPAIINIKRANVVVDPGLNQDFSVMFQYPYDGLVKIILRNGDYLNITNYAPSIKIMWYSKNGELKRLISHKEIKIEGYFYNESI